jgi:hypothetical protein
MVINVSEKRTASTFPCSIVPILILSVYMYTGLISPQHNTLRAKLGWKCCYVLPNTLTSSSYLYLLHHSLNLGNWGRDREKIQFRKEREKVKVGKGGRHLSPYKQKLEEWWLTRCRLQGIRYWFIHPETISAQASPSQPLFSSAPPPSQSSSCCIFLLFYMVQVWIKKIIPVEEE